MNVFFRSLRLPRCSLYKLFVWTSAIGVLLVPAIESHPCQSKLLSQLISYKNCVPKRILTRQCIGMCSTFSRVNPNNPSAFERSCVQCRETSIRYKKVHVNCPNADGSRTFVKETLEIPVPTVCSCEAWSDETIIRAT